mmetsp:Transcript_52313/g.94135  ORF Transcript_52313/g.94135 Transcript_52313/m.94135 type:complete len:241 (+) Transcript_52313:1492-2214(+)
MRGLGLPSAGFLRTALDRGQFAVHACSPSSHMPFDPCASYACLSARMCWWARRTSNNTSPLTCASSARPWAVPSQPSACPRLWGSWQPGPSTCSCRASARSFPVETCAAPCWSLQRMPSGSLGSMVSGMQLTGSCCQGLGFETMASIPRICSSASSAKGAWCISTRKACPLLLMCRQLGPVNASCNLGLRGHCQPSLWTSWGRMGVGSRWPRRNFGVVVRQKSAGCRPAKWQLPVRSHTG